MLDSLHEDLNRKTVWMSQKHGRLPYINDIVKVMFVAERTIRSRVQKMRESGMSKIIDFADPMDIK